MRGRIAHLSASLATLSDRWSGPCNIVRDPLNGRWSVMRDNGEESLLVASGKTPEDAAAAALTLWPSCSYCGGGVPEDSKAHAWPMCGQCPDTVLPPKWEPKESP